MTPVEPIEPPVSGDELGGGDYSAVVDRLVAAGADINAPGNGEPMSLIAMAEGNPEVQATLRKHGARG
jgi:hypothetical protein